MGRRWLVAALVCLGATADAAPGPTCRCATPWVLPVRDTVVPSNAKLWVFDAPDRSGRLDSITASTRVEGTGRSTGVTMFDLPLAPRTQYTFTTDDLTTKFTTADGPDTTPPAPPLVTYAAITMRPGRERYVARFAADIVLSQDAWLVKVTATDAAGATTLYLPQGRNDVCDPALWVSAGIVVVSFVAVDEAGNESPPVTMPLITVDEPAPAAPCTSARTRSDWRTHWEGGNGMFGVLVIAVFGGIGMLVLIVLILIWRGVRGVNAAHGAQDPEEVSLLVAEHLAGRARVRDALIIMLLGAAITSCVIAEARPVLLAIVLSIPYLRVIVAATRVLRLIEQPGATAELRGARLFVCAGQRIATIWVSRRAIAAARRRAVPSSSIAT